MKMLLTPGARTGCVTIPASKSQAHRLLICAALGTQEMQLDCSASSADIEATARCLNALGAEIGATEHGFRIRPLAGAPQGLRTLCCGESGSTLRFLLPLTGALGAQAAFAMEGRLPERPLAPLDTVLCAHGMRIARQGAQLLCQGQLEAGTYTIPGDVSSQYISGLLMALPLLRGDSRLVITGALESAGYVAMTEEALALAGITLEKRAQEYAIPGGQRCRLPAHCRVEGDWSNAAFFLCMGALSERGVTVEGLSMDSAQGDRAVLALLERFGACCTVSDGAVTVRRGALRGMEIDAAPVPDLIPVLSVVAALAEGETRIVNAARLRLKESDRLKSTAQLLRSLGGEVEELESGLVIHGRPQLNGGAVDTCRDHRIAMAAATAACACRGSVTVDGSQCVEKSYPRFWADFAKLEGGAQ